MSLRCGRMDSRLRRQLDGQDGVDVEACAGSAVSCVPPDVVADVLIFGDHVVGEGGDVLPESVSGGGGARHREHARVKAWVPHPRMTALPSTSPAHGPIT